MVRVRHCSFLVLLAFVLSCAGHKAVQSAPAAPVPPKDPWAWMPDDGTFVGQLALEPFRGTPLWSLWESARQDQRALSTLIDADKIQRAVFAGTGHGSEPPSFVAALVGPFGEGAVDAAAAQQLISREQQGLLGVYRIDGVAVAQVYPDLIVACSFDRVAWLAERSAQGPAIKVHDSALYKSLAARVALDSADFGVLAEDPEGGTKAMAQRQAKQIGLSFSAEELVRGGLSVKMGQPTQLSAVVETTGTAPAEALRSSLESSLSNLSGNIFVGLLGLRPLVSALSATQDGSYVKVGGAVKQEDFQRALDRLAGMLGATLSRGGAAQAAP